MRPNRPGCDPKPRPHHQVPGKDGTEPGTARDLPLVFVFIVIIIIIIIVAIVSNFSSAKVTDNHPSVCKCQTQHCAAKQDTKATVQATPSSKVHKLLSGYVGQQNVSVSGWCRGGGGGGGAIMSVLSHASLVHSE